jgi:enoyl-CoA hydratase/carnithine racemase
MVRAMTDRVLVTVTDGVAHLRLNRADKRNGVDLAMFEALAARALEVGRDPHVRCVVLSGEGKAFCAGLDWAAFMASPAASLELFAPSANSIANRAQLACWAYRELPVPVIGALHGATFGAGLQLALACDIRLAAPDTQLSVMEIRYGLVPDMTLTQTLLPLVRPDVARELVYTGRIVPAAEAKELGLVTRIEEDPTGAALALARQIAESSPNAIRAAKQLLDRAPALPAESALQLEASLQRELLGSPNQLEAVQAALGKRSPVFRDPA